MVSRVFLFLAFLTAVFSVSVSDDGVSLALLFVTTGFKRDWAIILTECVRQTVVQLNCKYLFADLDGTLC